jgi:hypothetical protein
MHIRKERNAASADSGENPEGTGNAGAARCCAASMGNHPMRRDDACSARTGLQAGTATQASSMLLEFPASP